MIEVHCWSCGKKLQFVGGLGFRDSCEYCHSDLHVCKSCQFYDPKVYNECREPLAEVVRDKERNNYCEYFQPQTGLGGKGNPKEDLLAAAEALFKKK